MTRSGRPDTMKAMTNTTFFGIFTGGTAMKHLKKAFCLLLAAVMLLALGVPAMAAG